MDKEGQPKSNDLLNKVKDALKPEVPRFGGSEKNDGNAVGNEFTGDYQERKSNAGTNHLGGNGKGSESSDVKNKAANDLSDAENQASQSKDEDDKTSGLVDKVRNGESNPGGFYNGSGGPGKGVRGKAGLKGKISGLKKKGPIAAIVAGFIVVATFMLGGQATMPFSMIAQFKESLDSIKTSNEARSETMFLKQLSKTELKDPVHQRYFGFGGTEFKVSNSQREKLAAQGIYIDDDFGGTGKSAMLFDDGSGKLKVLSANEGDIDVLKGVDPANVKLDGIDADVDFSKFEIDVGDVMTFKTAFNTNSDLHYGYIAGSRTWRGSVGAWFDNVTVKFIQSNKLTRNRFKDFQERVKAQNEGNTRSARKKAMQDALEPETRTMTSERVEAEVHEEVDEETGRVTGESADEVTRSTSLSSSGATKSEVRTKIREIVEGRMGNGSGVAGMAINITCSVFDAVGAVSLLVAAQEFLQIMQVTTGMFEAIDKTEAGDGNDAPIHEMAEALTTQAPTTRIKESDSDEIEEEVIPGKENTTAMNSAGSVSVYSNTPVDYEDESLKNFNVMSHLNNIWTWLGTSAASFSMCSMAKLTAAAIDVAIDFAKVVFYFATGGLGALATELGMGAATNIGIGTAVSTIVDKLTPIATKWFTRDLVSNLAGEDLGNAIFLGSVMYMGNNHMLGGGSPASRTKYAQFSMEQQNLIAEEADFQRATRSPFDITSKYTFMGSIMYRLAAIQTIKSPILGSVGTIGQMVSSSVMAMLPSASAYDVAKNLIPEEEYEKICPQLTSIGAVGDAACTPYIITDMSTIEMDPLEVVDEVRDLGGIDENGDILDGTNLANKIMDCDNRSMSSFGVIDQNVVQRHSTDISTGNSSLDNVINGTIGAVPVIGSVADVIRESNNGANLGWYTGENCVAKGGTMATSSEEGAGDAGTLAANGSATEDAGEWAEYRIYQRFIEDQRLLESINPEYESPVTAFWEKKEAENSVDDSYEGILARQAGMTVEQAEDTLALLDYYEYVDEYDPSERIAFGEETEIVKPIRLDDGDEAQETGVKGVVANLVNLVAFADVRNRTVMV